MTQDSNAGERDASPSTETPKDLEAGDKKPFKRAKDGKDGKPAKPPVKTERIAKVLARAGLASRREVERLIGLGKIAVNGRILETPAVLVAATDVITVDGQVMGKAEATRLWRYHKPVGLITTHSDPQGRPTLFEQLPRDLPRVISVGRLDLNSEGLLLLTNDGELARALEKPSSGWVRQYRVRALGHTSQSRLDVLKNGTTVDGVIYGPMEATLDKMAEKADGRANVWLTVSITEGKNREVRKVLESIGLKVNRLIRLAYGPFLLGNLETGDVEEVGPRVIRELLADVVPLKNLPPEGASQTQGAPRPRPGRDDAPAGRRGGGDRFRDRTAGERPGGDRFGGGRPGEDRPAYAKRPKPAFTEKREYKERDFDERPRFEGDGTARDRRPEREDGFRPRFNADRPRRDGDVKKPFAKKPYASRDAAEGDARSEYTPRPDRGAGNDRKAYGERKPAGDRTYGERKSYGDRKPASDRKGFGERPAFKPREKLDESGAYERAKREFGPRSDGPRPEGARPPARKPRFDRPAGEGSDARSSYTPRPDRGGDADRKPYAKKPYAARDGGGDGERKSYARKPYAPRDGAEGDRKPYAKKPYAARDGGDGDRKPFRSERPSGGKPGGFSRGPRPGGDRPGGDRPAGKPFGGRPGGKPSGDRKPRRDS